MRQRIAKTLWLAIQCEAMYCWMCWWSPNAFSRSGMVNLMGIYAPPTISTVELTELIKKAWGQDYDRVFHR